VALIGQEDRNKRDRKKRRNVLEFFAVWVLRSVRAALKRHDNFDVTKLPQGLHHDEDQALHVQTSQTALPSRSF